MSHRTAIASLHVTSAALAVSVLIATGCSTGGSSSSSSQMQPTNIPALTLERAAEAYGDRVTFAALDIGLIPQAATRFGVRGIPHLLFFTHGAVCCHFMGEIPWVYLRDKLERALQLQAQLSYNPHHRFTLPSQNSA